MQTAAFSERASSHASASSSCLARPPQSLPRARPSPRCSRRGLSIRAQAFALAMQPPVVMAGSPTGSLLGANNISVAPPKQTVLTGDDSPVLRIHSEAELNKVLDKNPRQLVVLMCKAMGCRPCKAFTRRYQRIADQFKGCVFLDIYGDESTDTRRLMIKQQVRVTPTFKLFREGECVHAHGGINEGTLRTAIEEYISIA